MKLHRLPGFAVALLVLAHLPSAKSEMPPAASSDKMGGDFDLQGFIDGELASGKKEVVIPPGRYRVRPKNAQHLTLNRLHDVRIVAEGVEMICTETTRALSINDCVNLTVRGLTIDYDPLPYTQGRIVALSPDKKIHDIELFAGYPDGDRVTGDRYEVYAPDTRTLRCPTYGGKLEKIDARHFRFFKQGGGDLERVGDVFVMGANWSPGGSTPHAIESDRCKNLRLDGVTVYASNCFGYFERYGDGNTYYRCKLERCPPSADCLDRADARLRSTNADAFHSKFAVRGPQLIECTAKYLGDDCVNICGNYHLVTACHGAELRVLANGDFLEAGEPVEVVTFEGVRLPDARVVAVEPDGTINEEEVRFRATLKLDAGLRARPNVKAYRVTLDRAVELPAGSLVCRADRTGNGFLVQGCDFGFNRSRGILIKGSDGKVVGNRIAGGWMEAIKVSPEYWWLESGSSNNVEISANTIEDCRSLGIAVYANGGNNEVAPSGAHRAITITGNTIARSPYPNIAVTSTDGLRIQGNILGPAAAGTEESIMMTNFLGLDPAVLQPIMSKNCRQIIETDIPLK